MRGLIRTRDHVLQAALLALLLCVGGIVPAAAEPTDPMQDFLQSQGWVSVEPPPTTARPPHSTLVVHALGFIGVPYRRGGVSFSEGFDCSGFVQAAFAQSLGITLPRRAVDQAQATTPIEASELVPGDLVFFNTLGSRYSHVGIYVGDRRFIHSPRSGASIRLENMALAYWVRRFNGARRVAPLPDLVTWNHAQ